MNWRKVAGGWPSPRALLILALAGCRGEEAPPAEAAPVVMPPENIAVAWVETLETGPYIEGSLRPRQEAVLRAQLTAQVVATYAEVGDAVASGQLLARLDAGELEATRRSALSAVETAARAAEFARSNVRRAEVLYRAGGLALRDVENARLDLANAESQLAEARARLATVEEQLAETVIRAPFTGRIAARRVSRGDVVQPGVELFTVIDPSTMRLEAELPAEHLHEVSVGTPARFRVRGYPGIIFEGSVERIAAAADSATRQVAVMVTIPNVAGTLVADLYADGQIESEIRRGIVIPEAAVIETDLGPAVMAVRQGRAVQVAVEIGVRDERAGLVMVVAGLGAGDTVLVGTAATITTGTPVVVRAVRPRVR